MAAQLATVAERKRSKYRNCPTIVDGIRFASKKEAKRWTQLRLLEMDGVISDLKRQPRYELRAEGGEVIGAYVGDFSYLDHEAITGPSGVCEDVKGVQTDLFRWKAKHFRAQYPDIDLRLT